MDNVQRLQAGVRLFLGVADFSLLVVPIRGGRGCLKIMIVPPASRKGFLERKRASQATSSCYYTVPKKKNTTSSCGVVTFIKKTETK